MNSKQLDDLGEAYTASKGVREGKLDKEMINKKKKDENPMFWKQKEYPILNILQI